MTDFSLIDIKRAYIAGIVDGEGSIMISKDKPQGKEVTPVYSLRLQVGNMNRELIDFLQTTWPGNVHTTKGGLHTWRLCGEESVKAIVKIKPYLIVKWRQAQVALEFWENRSVWARGKPVSKEVIEIREGYYSLMQKLNAKETGRR